jgi:hypothetical protein
VHFNAFYKKQPRHSRAVHSSLTTTVSLVRLDWKSTSQESNRETNIPRIALRHSCALRRLLQKVTLKFRISPKKGGIPAWRFCLLFSQTDSQRLKNLTTKLITWTSELRATCSVHSAKNMVRRHFTTSHREIKCVIECVRTWNIEQISNKTNTACAFFRRTLLP